MSLFRDISPISTIRTLMATALLVGCGEREARVPAVPWTELEPIVLQDTEGAYLGDVSGFAVLDFGYVVSDRRSGTLDVFDSTGERTGTYGRRGAGPGEWSFGPSIVVPVGATRVAVGDGPSTAILGVPTFAEQARIQKPSTGALPIGYHWNALVFGYVDRERGTAFVARPLDGAEPWSFGYTPEFARASAIVAGYFSHSAVAFFGPDSIATAFQSSNYLYFHASNDGLVDSILLPPMRRRGAVEDEMRLLVAGRTDVAEKLMYRPSYPQVLFEAMPGVWALVVADLTQIAGRMTGQLYMALITRQGRSCGEFMLPVQPDPLPYVAALRGTIYAISHVDRGDTSVPIVQRFVLDDRSCDAS